MQFRIKHLKQYGYSRNHWLVYRSDKPNMHSHVASKEVANKLISIINNGYIPTSKYLCKSASKLLTEEEFAKLRPYRKKQRYFNSNGKRRVG